MINSRLTSRMRGVLSVLLDADGEMYNSEIAERLGAPPGGGVIYTLQTLQREGYLASRLEDAGVRRGKRRRYYKLTPEGVKLARSMQR